MGFFCFVLFIDHLIYIYINGFVRRQRDDGYVGNFDKRATWDANNYQSKSKLMDMFQACG